MSGHNYPQITGQDGSTVHADDKHNQNTITSNGPLRVAVKPPIVLFGHDAIDTRSILEQLQQALQQNYQSSADTVNEQLAEVTQRVRELENQRQARELVSRPAGPVRDNRPVPFFAEFTVRVDVALPRWTNIYGNRDIRFTTDLDSSHLDHIWTTHVLCNGGQGKYDAAFPIRWTKWRANWDIVMRFKLYLRKGWTFVGEDEKHFGGIINDGAQSDLHPYCIAKFVNETDESLNLVTAKNVHRTNRSIVRCHQSCCQDKGVIRT